MPENHADSFPLAFPWLGLGCGEGASPRCGLAFCQHSLAVSKGSLALPLEVRGEHKEWLQDAGVGARPAGLSNISWHPEGLTGGLPDGVRKVVDRF